MNKKLVCLLTTVALTVLNVVSVFASETDLNAEKALIANHLDGVTKAVSTLVTFDNNCGEAAKMSMHGIVDATNGNVKWSVSQEEENYIKYLQACVGNAIENERVKKQNVAALTDLVKVNPTFQSQLDAAIAECNKAVADRMAAEATVIDVKAQFAAFNAAFEAGRQALGTTDSDAR